MKMFNSVQYLGLRAIVEEIIDDEAEILNEYGEDLCVKNTGTVAKRILEKFQELGIIELENE